MGAGVDRGRLHRVCDQPVPGGPLPGAARHRRGRSPIPATRTCWPRSSGWTGPTTVRSAGDSTVAEQVKAGGPGAPEHDLDRGNAQATSCGRLLREFYPAALAAFRRPDRPGRVGGAGGRADAPAQGRRLSAARVTTVLRKAGRQRYLGTTRDRDRGRVGHRAAAGPAPGWTAPTAPACPRWWR